MILVTGAGGFCGSHLCARLRRDGQSFRALFRRPSDRPYESASSCVDLTDVGATENLICSLRPDIIFHLAGRSYGAIEELQRDNVAATSNLLSAVSRHTPQCVTIVMGSAAEYGPGERSPIDENAPCAPSSPYGLTKLAVTRDALRMAMELGLDVRVARPFNIVGAGSPRSMLVGALLSRIRDALRRGEREVSVGRLDTVRDFIAVEDVVEGLLRLSTASSASRIFNLCSGVGTPIRDIVERLLLHAPGISARVDSTLIRPDDVPVVFGDPSRAWIELGFRAEVPVNVALDRAWSGPAMS